MKKKNKKPEYLLQLDGAIYFVEKLPGKRAKKTELDGEMVLRLIERTIAEYAEKELQKAAFNKAWFGTGVVRPDEFSSPPR